MLLSNYIELFWRRRVLILSITAVFCSFGIFSWHSKRAYVAHSVIIVNKSQAGSLLQGVSQSSGAGSIGMSMLARDDLQRNILALKSTPFLQRLARRVLEEPQSELLALLSTSRPSIVSVVVSFFASPSVETSQQEAPDRILSLGKALGGVTSVSEGDAGTIEISLTLPDRMLAVAAAKLVTDEAVAFLTSRELQELEDTRRYLTEKLVETEQKLHGLDSDFDRLESGSAFPLGGGSGAAGALNSALDEFQRAKQRLDENEKLISALKEKLSRKSAAMGSRVPANPELIVSLRKDIETLTAKRDKLEHEGFASDSYQMKVTRDQLENARLQLGRLEELGESGGGPDAWSYAALLNNLKVLNQENLFLSSKLDSAQKLIKPDGNGTPTVRLRKLGYIEKRSELQYSFYSELTKRLFDVDMRRISAENQISVVEPPSAGRIIRKPTLSRSVFLSLFFALAVGMTLAFQIEQANPLLLSSKDLDALLIRVLGTVPDLTPGWRTWARPAKSRSAPADDSFVRFHHGDAREGLVFKHLRARLLHLIQKSETPIRLITVTSAGQGEGKSFIALNLTLTLARMGKPVLLIDADLRARRATKVLAPNAVGGLCSDPVGGHRPAAECVIRECLPGLDFLPAGYLPEEPSEFFSSPWFPKVLESVASNYEFVIIDTAPAVDFPDAVTLSELCDATILVGCSGKTRLKSFASVIQSLDGAVDNLWGVVNRSSGPTRPIVYPTHNEQTTKVA